MGPEDGDDGISGSGRFGGGRGEGIAVGGSGKSEYDGEEYGLDLGFHRGGERDATEAARNGEDEGLTPP